MAIDQVYIRLDFTEFESLVEYLDEVEVVKKFAVDSKWKDILDLQRLTKNIRSQARSQAKITHCELRGEGQNV